MLNLQISVKAIIKVDRAINNQPRCVSGAEGCSVNFIYPRLTPCLRTN